VKVRARALLGQFLLYVLALLAALVALAILAGIIAAGLFTNQIFTPGGSIAVDIAQMSQSSWLTVLGLVLGYLLVLATFALLGEVLLGYGYWMLVARGATIA